MKTNFFKNISIVVLLSFLILICPAFAANPPDTDTVMDQAFYGIEHHDSTYVAGTNTYLNSIRIYKVEEMSSFVSLLVYGKYVTGPAAYTILDKPVDNTSQLSITLWDDATNKQMGVGYLAYSLDMNNNIVISLLITGNSWNTYNLTGDRTINISYRYGTSSGLKDCFFFNKDGHCTGWSNLWYIMQTGYLSAGDPGYTHTDRVWFGDWDHVPDFKQFANTSMTNYINTMWVQYNREHGSDPNYDIWSFTRENNLQHYKSNINLSYWSNNSYVTVLSETGINNTANQLIPVDKNVWMQVLNPVTGHSFNYYWVFVPSGTLSLNVYKGANSAVPLLPNENTTVEALYFGDYNLLGRAQWIWSAGSSTLGPIQKTKVFSFNVSNGTWELDGSGVYNLYTDVLRIKPEFMYANTDGNWTGSISNSISLTLWDQNNIDVGQAESPIYVGNPYQSFARYWVYGVLAGNQAILPNAQLWIYDATDDIYLSSGETLNTGVKLNTTTLGHNYVAWASLGNYTQKEYCFANPGADCTRVTGGTANFTITHYGTNTVVLYMYGFGGTGNATVTFSVTDENFIPIKDAIVHPIVGATGLTNDDGLASFTTLINGSIGQYSVLKEGWTSVTAKYEIYDGEFIHVVLHQKTPVTTATLTPTTTTPVPTITPPSDITDLWGNIGYWFQLAGIPLGQLNLVGAVIIMGTFTFAPMYLIGIHGGAAGTGMAGLIGLILGFLVSAIVGFISMLWVAIVLVICGVAYAMLIWRGGGG